MVSILFLLVSLVGAWFTFNAYNPMFAHRRRAVISFFAGWLTTELALHQILWQLAAAIFFAWLGALSAWPGKLGLAISLGSWMALGAFYLRARDAEEVVERSLREGLGDGYRSEIHPDLAAQLSAGVRLREILLPFSLRDPAVERIRDIPYWRVGSSDLKLDLYRPRDPERYAGRGMPVLLQVHGGGWVLGSKNEQGVPLMLRMAAHGWLCVSIDYRLSPAATFPDHIVDVKRAIEWIRANAPDWGGDPRFVVITGGSAGGHLASLAALTANAPGFQPGFEESDTRVSGCVSFYGVYDFTDANGVYRNPGLRDLLERWVIRRRVRTRWNVTERPRRCTASTHKLLPSS
jgi:acetyl esterase/lipase